METGYKEVNLTRREKALLALMASEIKRALPDTEAAERVIEGWVRANNLPISKTVNTRDLNLVFNNEDSLRETDNRYS